MRDDVRDWIALSLTTGIGPMTAQKVLKRFGFPGAAFRASRQQFEGVGLSEDTREAILSQDGYREADTQLLWLQQHGASAITIQDAEYPLHLREIPDPPIVLYFKGDLTSALEQPCVAIVGARHCSTYGQNAATRLARDLTSHGVTVVSGLARGIDTAAHQGAIESRGLTIAIMGTGLDERYPKENSKLADTILDYGALVTEFPVQKPPLPQNFPYRNRIISGLCRGVVVVEASERSGSLITARMAMEQNREVFAVPGNITSAKSIGPNRLIQDGAKLVLDWQDVVAEFSYDLQRQLRQADEVPSGDLIKARADLASLTEDERQLFGLIGLDEPIHIDVLLVQSKLNQPRLVNALFQLELKDRIHQLPGKLYVRKL